MLLSPRNHCVGKAVKLPRNLTELHCIILKLIWKKIIHTSNPRNCYYSKNISLEKAVWKFALPICSTNILLSTLPPNPHPTPSMGGGGALMSVTKSWISDDKEISGVSSTAPELQIYSPVNSKLLNDDKLLFFFQLFPLYWNVVD